MRQSNQSPEPKTSGSIAPHWSPDERYIALQRESARWPGWSIRRREPAGSDVEDTLAELNNMSALSDWSPDGLPCSSTTYAAFPPRCTCGCPTIAVPRTPQARAGDRALRMSPDGRLWRSCRARPGRTKSTSDRCPGTPDTYFHQWRRSSALASRRPRAVPIGDRTTPSSRSRLTRNGRRSAHPSSCSARRHGGNRDSRDVFHRRRFEVPVDEQRRRTIVDDMGYQRARIDRPRGAIVASLPLLWTLCQPHPNEPFFYATAQNFRPARYCGDVLKLQDKAGLIHCGYGMSSGFMLKS